LPIVTGLDGPPWRTLWPIAGSIVLVVGAGLLTWFGVFAATEYRFYRHSDVVPATVLHVEHHVYEYRGSEHDDARYLVAVSGRPDWVVVTSLDGARVGDDVSVMVDRRDPGTLPGSS
jgi:uncharacterized protein DUF3592